MSKKGQKYSNLRAMSAMARASFTSILRSPSAVIFSLVFPMVFIITFGFIGNNIISVKAGISKHCDKNNFIYHVLDTLNLVHLVTDQSEAEMRDELNKGRLDALIDIQKNPNAPPAYIINLHTTHASAEKGNILRSLLNTQLYKANMHATGQTPIVAEVREYVETGRAYKTIDFILPGQLGFSLLSSGVFGTAFVFISLRLTLVIKRFFATPVRRSSIILGEALSRLAFALLGALIIIGIGHFAFGFTLIKGWITVLNMLALSTIGLVVFMGFGFFVSGIVKSESSVPPIANLFTLPQFLLSGTFFSIDAFPSWLQPVSKSLPLTYLNDAMRKVAFEGAAFTDLGHELFILSLWGVIVYALAVKFFKWE